MRDATVESAPEANKASPPGVLGGASAMSSQNLSWQAMSCLLAICLLGLVLRLWQIQQWSFGVVEAETFRAVTQPFFAGEHGFAASPERSHPLVFLVMRWLLDFGWLPGYSEGWLRLPFAFAGCLLIPLVALLAHSIFGRGVAGLAALLVALHPAHIQASQTADPIVFAISFAVAAGLCSWHGKRRSAGILVLAAGACHPLGWLGAIGLVASTKFEALWHKTPKFVWLLLLLHVVVLLPCMLDGLGLSLLLLASIALALRPVAADLASIRSLAGAALLPLLVAGIWWWFDPEIAASAILVSSPPLILLAAWVAVQYCLRLRESEYAMKGERSLSRRLLMIAPSIMLLGELATATFLYSVIYAGARPAWREASRALLHSAPGGAVIEVLAASGTGVMQAYLRPSHWRGAVAAARDGTDPHPCLHVSWLPADPALAMVRLQTPGVALVLLHEEWQALSTWPALLALAGSQELLHEFVIAAVWSSPLPRGDQSLYLLRRRSVD